METNWVSKMFWDFVWGLTYLIAVLFIVMYVLSSAGMLPLLYAQYLSTGSSALVSVFASFFFAFKVADVANTRHQKMIAIKSVRQIRRHYNYLTELERITSGMYSVADDHYIRQNFSELLNHIRQIKRSVQNSELDYSELLNEELQEDRIITVSVKKEFQELYEMESEARKLQRSKRVEGLGEEMKKIWQTIQDKESFIQKTMMQSPVGLPYFDYESQFSSITSLPNSSTITLPPEQLYKMAGRLTPEEGKTSV